MGFNGPVDLDLNALNFIMELLGVEDRLNVYRRVHKLYRHIISKHYIEQKHQQSAKQAAKQPRIHKRRLR